MTAWSTSQGWVCTDNRPVNSRPSPSASAIAAPSNGCSALPNPTAVTSPARTADTRGQNRCRWNAYVGRSTRPDTDPNNRDQSTPTPFTNTRAAAATNSPTPPAPRRNVPNATPPPHPSSVSCTPTVNTGCALHSTNTRCPTPANRPTASAKRTGRRKFSNQYRPPNSPSTTQSPVTVDTIGTTPRPATTDPNNPTTSSANPSTNTECDA